MSLADWLIPQPILPGGPQFPMGRPPSAGNIPGAAAKLPPLAGPFDAMNAATSMANVAGENKLREQQAILAAMQAKMQEFTLGALPGALADSKAALQSYLDNRNGGGAAAGTPGDAGQGMSNGAAAGPADLVGKYESEGLANKLGISPYAIGTGGADLSHASLNENGFPIWEGHEGSHAAGRYQFQPDTWEEYAKPLGIKDFSPESQDAVFRGAYLDKGYGHWAPYNPALAAALKRGEGAAEPAASPLASLPARLAQTGPLTSLPAPGSLQSDAGGQYRAPTDYGSAAANQAIMGDGGPIPAAPAPGVIQGGPAPLSLGGAMQAPAAQSGAGGPGLGTVRGLDPIALALAGGPLRLLKFPDMYSDVIGAIQKSPEYLGQVKRAETLSTADLSKVRLAQSAEQSTIQQFGADSPQAKQAAAAVADAAGMKMIIPGRSGQPALVLNTQTMQYSAQLPPGYTQGERDLALAKPQMVPGVGLVDPAAAEAAANRAGTVPQPVGPAASGTGVPQPSDLAVPASPVLGAPPPSLAPQLPPSPSPSAAAQQPGLIIPTQTDAQKQVLAQNLSITDDRLKAYQDEGKIAVSQASDAASIVDMLNRVKLGWGAGTVQQAAKIMSSIGVPDSAIASFLHTNPAAGDELNKMFLRFSADAVRAMGAREPGSVISLFAHAFPNLETHPDAALLMTNALRMNALWKKDRANAADEFAKAQQNNMGRFGENYTGMLGFENAFEKTNAARDYWRAAVAMSHDDPIAWGGTSRAEKQRILQLIPAGSTFYDWNHGRHQKPGLQ